MTGRRPQISDAASAYLRASIAAMLLFLLVIALAALTYRSGITIKGKPLYLWMLREDGPVEQLTAIFLALAAVISLIAAFKIPAALRWARGFLVLFAAFSALMALEEVSWGQRALDIESGPFFQQYSDQQEINFHNVLQRYLKQNEYAVTTTRGIAAIVLLLYGVVLPALNAFPRPRSLFRRLRLVVPPPALASGFLIGALLAWFDWPTRREEEIGEFLFSLCFALLVPLWLLQQRHAASLGNGAARE